MSVSFPQPALEIVPPVSPAQVDEVTSRSATTSIRHSVIERRRLRWLSLAALVLVACEQSPVAPVASSLPGLRLTIVSGDKQLGVVNKELASPIVVKATDAQGKAVSGVSVNFVVTSGAGRVFAGVSTTNSQGMAQDYWTLGTSTAVAQSLEVRSVDPATGQKNVYGKFTARPLAGPPVYRSFVDLQFDDPRDCVVPVGEATTSAPYAMITDEFFNPASGGIVQFSMFDAGWGLGTVTGTLATSGSDGKARLGSWVLGNNPGLYGLTALAGAAESDINCYAYPTAGRTLAADPANPSSARAGTQVALAVNVIADGSSDFANYYVGRVTSILGGGVELGGLKLGGGGEVWVFVLLGTSPGVNTFTVTVSGIGSIVLTVTGT